MSSNYSTLETELNDERGSKREASEWWDHRREWGMQRTTSKEALCALPRINNLLRWLSGQCEDTAEDTEYRPSERLSLSTFLPRSSDWPVLNHWFVPYTLQHKAIFLAGWGGSHLQSQYLEGWNSWITSNLGQAWSTKWIVCQRKYCLQTQRNPLYCHYPRPQSHIYTEK